MRTACLLSPSLSPPLPVVLPALFISYSRHGEWGKINNAVDAKKRNTQKFTSTRASFTFTFDNDSILHVCMSVWHTDLVTDQNHSRAIEAQPSSKILPPVKITAPFALACLACANGWLAGWQADRADIVNEIRLERFTDDRGTRLASDIWGDAAVGPMPSRLPKHFTGNEGRMKQRDAREDPSSKSARATAPPLPARKVHRLSLPIPALFARYNPSPSALSEETLSRGENCGNSIFLFFFKARATLAARCYSL